MVAELARGARLGVRECQFQFRFRRWNCSSHSKAFGRILQQGQCEEETSGGSEERVEVWGGCRSPTSPTNLWAPCPDPVFQPQLTAPPTAVP